MKPEHSSQRSSGGSPATGMSLERARLRILTCAEPDLERKEIPLADGAVTIGRDDSCEVVLQDNSVSRRHARVEGVPEGFKLTDLGSSNGTWIGDERITEKLLRPGAQFSIGSTVFECVGGGKEQPSDDSARTVLVPPEEVGATILAPADEQPEVRFWLEILESGDAALAGQEIAVHSTEAILGRDEDCTVVLDDQAISRRHARVERTTEGFRVTDLGSTNGVWLGDQRIDEPVVLEPGRPVLIGTATRLAFYTEPREQRQAEPQPQPALEIPEVDAAKEIPEVDAAKTLFIQSTAEEIARTRPLEAEGESIEVRANEPFLIDDPGTAWYVVEGGIDVFTVSIEGGKPAGTRSHFLGVLPGQCLFGFDLQGQGSGFLAVGKPGTRLRKVTVSRLRELAGGPGSESVAQLVETWVAGLSRSLARDVPTPGEWDLLLRPGEGASIGPAQRASAGAGVAWVDIWSGSALFIDMAIPVFSGRRTLFPVTPDSWIQPVGDEFGELSLEPRSTDQAVADRELWQGLQVFHQVLCECEFINKKLAAVDEFIRLQDKAQYAEAAKEAAYDAIGSVLRSEAATPREFLQTGSPEPIYQACRMVGEALGMEVKKHPGADQSLTYEERVNAIASTSGFRTRVVALRGEWWKGDHGPLLAQRQKTQDPVALLPTGPTSYECLDPRTGETREVDDEVADSLSGFAYSFYRPFPEGKISVRDLIRFGARGLKHDLLTLIGLAALIGILGTATPYFIGQVFDRAVPDSNTRLLFGFGLALIGAGVAAFAFRFTQAVATLRVQGKMESSIQAALWDRLMNLPANFFRDYSAGDLADRASGIDAIQSLVSGAGVLAILGSISGLFYVALMLAYSFLLAGVAVVLTGFYVGVTWLCNYLQLRHQRVELGLQGRIGGLVLNLITGVTKLRTSGAEHHAFREWAQKFSEQRKIAFTIGRIQNFATVFGNIFPPLSLIVIFGTMLWAQSGSPDGEAILTTGQFIAFAAAFGLFQKAMQALGDASMNMLRVVPVYERLKPILTTEPEVDNSKAYPGKLNGQIELSHVSFRYTEDGPGIIEDLSLKIRPAEMVAFVGASGCGKSTLLRLMLGFETPQSGAIYYDGQDLSSLDLRMLRQQLGVVLQQSQVLPTDIYRNIVGVSSRSTEEAWEAAENAGLADDIRMMPMQMHTYVAEGGGTLSGGQRQRLMIARAVVNKPKILFLDEATSALDNKAQAIVTESIDRLEATRVVIAHRLSTIIKADKICYLDDGGIAEMGTYDELMEKNGLFAQLAKRQIV